MHQALHLLQHYLQNRDHQFDKQVKTMESSVIACYYDFDDLEDWEPSQKICSLGVVNQIN